MRRFFLSFVLLHCIHYAANSSTTTSPKTVNYAGQSITATYFKQNSDLDRHYNRQQALFLWAMQLMHFLNKRVCCDIDEPYSAFRFELPAVRSAGSYFGIDVLNSGLYSSLSEQRHKREPHRLNFLITYIFGILIDEVEGFIAVELEDPMDYYQWSQFSGASRKRNLVRLQGIAGKTASQCQSYFPVIAELKRALGPVRNLIHRKEKYLREKGHLFQIHGIEIGDANDLKYQDGSGESLQVGGKESAEIGQKVLQKDRETMIESEGRKKRVDGICSIVTYDFPRSHEVTVELQIGGDLKSLVSLTVTGSSVSGLDRFWVDKVKLAEEQLKQYIQKQGAAIVSQLPASLQLEGKRRPVSLQMELSFALICRGDELGSVIPKEYLYFEVPGIISKIPIHESSHLPTLSKIEQFQIVKYYAVALAANDRNQRAPHGRIWMPEARGACDSSIALNKLVDVEELCIQFPPFVDLRDVAHTIWPTCLGFYPPGTIIFSRSRLTSATKESSSELAELERERNKLLEKKHQVMNEQKSERRMRQEKDQDYSKYERKSLVPSSFDVPVAMDQSLPSKGRQEKNIRYPNLAPKPIQFIEQLSSKRIEDRGQLDHSNLPSRSSKPLSFVDLENPYQQMHVVSALPESSKHPTKKEIKRKKAMAKVKKPASQESSISSKMDPTGNEMLPEEERLDQITQQIENLRNKINTGKIFTGMQQCSNPIKQIGSLKFGEFSGLEAVPSELLNECRVDRTGAQPRREITPIGKGELPGRRLSKVPNGMTFKSGKLQLSKPTPSISVKEHSKVKPVKMLKSAETSVKSLSNKSQKKKT